MFKHGQAVTLTDINGTEHTGNLHLPDAAMSMHTRSGWVEYAEPRTTSGALGVHTLTRPDGSRFRTEGRLS
jgi:hypothetical protein